MPVLWSVVRWWARRGLPGTAGRVATVVAVGRLATRFLRSSPETIYRAKLKPGEGIEIRTRTPIRKDPHR